MKFTSGYKHQLFEEEWFNTPVTGYTISIDYGSLDENGFLLIRKGYAWDGASGPAKDDKTNMRGSAAHDLFYQFIRMKKIDLSERRKIDNYFIQLCKEDGMTWLRRKYYKQGVFRFGAGSAIPGNTKTIQEAP